jgi:hypothetical protein
MTSPSTLHSQLVSRPGRRPRRVDEGEELGKKPKKVNSEVRKQQNRIASRNYRRSFSACIIRLCYRINVLFYVGEKRKRKLQYLQQLIRDGSNDEQTPEASPQQHEAHLRSLSAEYDAVPSSSPYMLPTNNDFASISSSSTTALGPAPVASTASYDTHMLPTTQTYSPFESSWNSHIYHPPPQPNMAYTPAWPPSIDYSSRLTPRPENFQFSPPLAQPAFEQATSPYHHPRELVPNADQYVLGPHYGHYTGSQSQTPGIPSVSLPTPSSYFQGHYPGPH